jgi:CRP-like cAMP-binding protein
MMEFTDSAKLVHLKLCSVFQELSTGILAELARQTSHRQIEPGEALLEEGKVGEKIFVLTAGNLIVSKGTNAEEIADIKPVALVGEMEALSPLNTPNFASVKADKDGAGAVVLEIGRDEFLEFLGDQPEVMRSIIAHMARNLMATADRLDEVTHGPRDFDDRLKRFDSLLDSIDR